jgi:hypothetical protein
MFCSSEQTHPEYKNPIRNIGNYFLAVSGSGGFMYMAGGLTCYVECGGKQAGQQQQQQQQGG